MALVPAPIAAPHVIDRRLGLSLLHLERRNQGVLRRYGHGSRFASDVYADREFERHAASPKGRLHIHAAESTLGSKQDLQTVVEARLHNPCKPARPATAYPRTAALRKGSNRLKPLAVSGSWLFSEQR